MPRVYTFAPDARLERRGNTDYVNVVRTDGQIVSRPVRTFRGDLGSWRVTNVGKMVCTAWATEFRIRFANPCEVLGNSPEENGQPRNSLWVVPCE